jgi:class 3 adenylate cyclase/tetratricopeptide (TPR) repeat protein
MLRFADFELDRGAYQLRRAGRPVHLERIPLDLLFLLAERRGQLVSRDEIVERIWGKGIFLDSDTSINVAVRKIRKALGDDAEAPRFVVTVPAKGYRFVADVPEESQAAVNPPSSTQLAPAAPKKSEQSQIRQADTSAPENLEGERKTVTMLLLDFKGSTRLVEDLDPEEVRAIVDPALKLMIDAVHQYDGYVTRSTDDGIFAMFGAPIAHEDHPQRALSAALRMQAELKRYAEKLRAEKGVHMQVRAGAHTGEVVVREIRTGENHTEYGPIGHSTGVAARLQALAAPGSIAISEALGKLVEGYFVLKPVGPARIKGVREPLEIYEVTGLGPLRTRLQRGAARGYTKFVGRQREMETLKHAAGLAHTGHGQIVAAVAEPGVGKSRLFFEFKAKNQPGWVVLEDFSVPCGKASAYLPVLDLLHSYFDIKSDDDARKRKEKIAGKIAVLDRTLEDALPYLFVLLGIVEGEDPLRQMDGQVKKRRTLEAIKRILLRESLNQPLMVEFEDLHLIDEETQGFLNVLADSIGTARILLLVNYRPEYQHRWGSKTYYTQLRLDPLGHENADAMLQSLIGTAPELEPLKRFIIEKTEGNPLFMEEIYLSLVEDGSLVRNGATHLSRNLEALKVPATVQAILASRIDRLPAAEKDLLQTLAVIGKEFPLLLAREVIRKPDDELDCMLTDLQLAEFIYEQPAVGGIEYTFKHALTQEVTYNSILVARRKALHERIARAIEEVFANQIDNKLTQLANHYVHGGNIAKAVFYLDLAAQRAMRGSAYGEAVDLLRSGLELIKTLPDDRARDRMEISWCLNLYEAAKVVQVRGLAPEQILNRARELCEKVQDDAGLFKVLERLSDHHGNRLDASATRSVRDDLIKVAERNRDPLLLVRVRNGLGRTFLLEGCFEKAEEQFNCVLEKPGNDLDGVDRSISELKSHCYGMSAWNVWFLGYPLAALTRSDKSVAISTAIGLPVTSARNLAGRSALHLLMRNPEAALQSAQAALKICNQEGLSWALRLSRLYYYWAQIQRGDAPSGITALLGGRTPTPGIAARIHERAARDGTWGGSTLTRFFTCLAEGCLQAGYVQAGLEVVDESLAVAHTSGVAMYEAETSRLKGELLTTKDATNPAPAEQCYREAIDVARKQHAKSWELRATVSLARLLRDTNRRDEARVMLSEIYNWFTEGFDTADLKDAKALLDELSDREA